MPNKFAIEPANKESVKNIIDGINEYNLSKVAALGGTWTPLDFVIKDDSGVEIAGILSGIGYWKGLEIRIIWVKENYRKEAIGTKLLKYVENLAIENGATVSMLDTFDFQAEEFYIKNGYEVVGEIKNFPPGHKRIYLSKNLAK